MTAPFHVWVRGALIAAFAVGAFAASVRLALAGEGAARPIGAALAVGLVALAAYLAWVYLPDVDLPGRSPRRGPAGRGLVALTFDDGPNGEHTARILDVLRAHGARATFFCTGEGARRAPALVRRMVEEGHVVGNHTLSHRKLAWLAPAEVRAQIVEAQRAIEEAGAPRPRWFRAPHGFKSPFLPGVLRDEALRLVAWSHGVWDTDRPGASAIAERAKSVLEDGEILLLHDGTPGADRSQTADALEAILVEIGRRGLRPVTLPELLESR